MRTLTKTEAKKWWMYFADAWVRIGESKKKLTCDEVRIVFGFDS